MERLDPTSLVRSLSAFGVIATPAEVKLATELRQQSVQPPSPMAVAPAAPVAQAPVSRQPSAAAPAVAAPSTAQARAPIVKPTPVKPAPSAAAAAPQQAPSAQSTPARAPAAQPQQAQPQQAQPVKVSPPSVSVSASPLPSTPAPVASPISAASLALAGVDPAEVEAIRTRYKKLLTDPVLFTGFTESAQISAHASRFDAASALQLTDKTPLVKVLHFDNLANGWLAFDCKAPVYMVRVRVFNGVGSKWDVQYSDTGAEGSFKSCGRIELASSEWNAASWRPAGAHRYWRLFNVENKGQNWYEKVEWYSVPADVMSDMKKLMDKAQQAQAAQQLQQQQQQQVRLSPQPPQQPAGGAARPQQQLVTPQKPLGAPQQSGAAAPSRPQSAAPASRPAAPQPQLRTPQPTSSSRQ